MKNTLKRWWTGEAKPVPAPVQLQFPHIKRRDDLIPWQEAGLIKPKVTNQVAKMIRESGRPARNFSFEELRLMYEARYGVRLPNRNWMRDGYWKARDAEKKA
jgi:hypothetical protein